MGNAPGSIGNTTDVVVTTLTEIGDRRGTIAQAALEVLEAEGGRGLTHRAVDRRARLGEGSTSNYFPTREALLTAALQRLVELERPAVQEMKDLAPGGPYEPRRAAELVAGLIGGWLSPERFGLTVARYELILEARRRPRFQLELDEVRREYRLLAEQLLPAAGCAEPRRHAPHLLTILDGIMVNQLFASATALTDAEMADQLTRFFTSC
jgi:DNA-binding transcriptional regulator YbjK